jgi:hypothetical protein
MWRMGWPFRCEAVYPPRSAARPRECRIRSAIPYGDTASEKPRPRSYMVGVCPPRRLPRNLVPRFPRSRSGSPSQISDNNGTVKVDCAIISRNPQGGPQTAACNCWVTLGPPSGFQVKLLDGTSSRVITCSNQRLSPSLRDSDRGNNNSFTTIDFSAKRAFFCTRSVDFRGVDHFSASLSHTS